MSEQRDERVLQEFKRRERRHQLLALPFVLVGLFGLWLNPRLDALLSTRPILVWAMLACGVVIVQRLTVMDRANFTCPACHQRLSPLLAPRWLAPRLSCRSCGARLR